ncbi:MAG: class I SAM-dependent methyltransferase [Anaerolineae bacterium]|nr:class I SAM-dependent methyltransferase [Anaerolineae bacterium]
MICRWGRPDGARVLVDGCGVGMYVRALRAYTPHLHALDIEAERVTEAATIVPDVCFAVAAAEALPYTDGSFDLVLSHEVIEHVADDRQVVREMVRVLRPGGRAVIFCPNRLYPFETHGHYWQGRYHFGNTPLINWLPDRFRRYLAPHVRAYTGRGLRNLLRGLPVRVVTHTQVYPGYDNVVARHPRLGRALRAVTYAAERTPLRAFGLSHFLVLEKIA